MCHDFDALIKTLDIVVIGRDVQVGIVLLGAVLIVQEVHEDVEHSKSSLERVFAHRCLGGLPKKFIQSLFFLFLKKRTRTISRYSVVVR